MPSYPELLVLLVVGLLVFGRRLPEVGQAIGKTVVQLRKGLVEFKAQIAADESIQEAKSAMHELQDAAAAPREMANPQRWMEDLSDESLASPGPQATETSSSSEQAPFTDLAEQDAPAPKTDASQ